MAPIRCWVDVQLPPSFALRLCEELEVESVHLIDLGLADRPDTEVFQRAREAVDLFVTKDMDFVELLERLGPPPRVLWITCGNCKNSELWGHVRAAWDRVMSLLAAGETLVEISGPWPPRR